MTASRNLEELLSCLLTLQQACIRGPRSAIEQSAASCLEIASRLGPDLVVGECDQERLRNLRLRAHATLEFLRRTVRYRGMRLTTRRFRQF